MLRPGASRAVLARGPFRAFGNPQFRLLWAGSLFSVASFFMVLIARGWLVLDLTDSPFLVTAVSAVPMLPMALLSPLGGVLADRVSRRFVLILGDSISLVVLVAMAVLILADVIQVWHIFLLSLVHGLTFSLAMPARMAAVADVVGERNLASGVALSTTIFSASQLAGPAPAGYLIDLVGAGWTFMVAALMMVPALGMFYLLRLPASEPWEDEYSPKSVFASIREGVAYVRGQPLIVGLLLLGVVFGVFGMPYQALLPVFARDILRSGATGLGLLGLAIGVGAISGSIAVASFSDPRQIRFLLIGGGTAFGLLIVLFALSSVFWLSFGLTLVLGFTMQVSLTSNMALVQLAVPSYIRGRVLSLRMAAMGIGPVGMLLLGVGAEQFGAPSALAVMGAISSVLAVVVVLAFPALRHAQVRPERERTILKPADG